MINKLTLSDEEIDQLNDVFKLYVKQGVNYNDKINDLYLSELRDDSPIT